MAKRLTVFYSWQSDTPSSVNRTFIEKALDEALKRLQSDAIREDALRNVSIELEKDTKGIPGSPPIVATILRKIEDCAAFVADLTFVGESLQKLQDSSETPRLFPNPNVLIEYGYALKCHSHSKMIGVMNTAFGEPNAETLPFDLRHLRHPITYRLEGGDTKGLEQQLRPALQIHRPKIGKSSKSAQFEKLTQALIEALRLILSQHGEVPATRVEFVRQKPTKSAAVFFDNASDLIPDESWGAKPNTCSMPEGAKVYLRLSPKVAVPPIDSEFEAHQLTMKGNLQPLGRVNGYRHSRNEFGAAVYEGPQDEKLYHVTQLFLTRELWGIDAEVLNADSQKKQEENVRRWMGSNYNPITRQYIPVGYIEDYFVKALQNYIAFAESSLGLKVPLRVEAGLVGVKGSAIVFGADLIGGNSIRDSVQWETDVSDEKPPWELLGPFFDKIWMTCGTQRNSQHQGDLVRRFGG